MDTIANFSPLSSLSPEFSRRRFLGVSGVLVLGASLPVQRTLGQTAAPTTFAPNLWLAIDGDGTVRATVHRSEMGQGIRTALTQVIADELDADWSRVEVVQAQGDVKYGDQNTDGSRSITQNYDRLRAAGATARLMLRQAAAKHWGVAVDTVSAGNHEVVHAASGRRLGYGELASQAAMLPVPENAPLKKETEHRFIGKPVTHVDAGAKAPGQGALGAPL
ncbi:MAG: molybdopterin-dependent oxidoreductase [Gammaproteobacteria bacterium]|nr:molybdopterin-dependent oxidoreductase [Gammaproteobacteria bacterium]